MTELEKEFTSSIQSNEIVQNVRVGRAILATFIAALGPLSFGYCMGYSSSALEDLLHQSSSASATGLTDGQGSWFSVSWIVYMYVDSTFSEQTPWACGKN